MSATADSAIAVMVRAQRDAARKKAWDALAHGKLWMWGYWASKERQLSGILGESKPSPWSGLVAIARGAAKADTGGPVCPACGHEPHPGAVCEAVCEDDDGGARWDCLCDRCPDSVRTDAHNTPGQLNTVGGIPSHLTPSGSAPLTAAPGSETPPSPSPREAGIQ